VTKRRKMGQRRRIMEGVHQPSLLSGPTCSKEQEVDGACAGDSILQEDETKGEVYNIITWSNPSQEYLPLQFPLRACDNAWDGEE